MKKFLNEIVRETLLSHCSPMKGVTVDGGEGYFIPLNSLGPLTVATNSRGHIYAHVINYYCLENMRYSIMVSESSNVTFHFTVFVSRATDLSPFLERNSYRFPVVSTLRQPPHTQPFNSKGLMGGSAPS